MFPRDGTEETEQGEQMAGHNPYAPTQASLKSADTPAGTGGLWRDDDRLIVAHGATFPQRCVKCNEPSEQPHKMRKVYWHHPAVYLLLLGYAILYIIVALIVRRTAEVNPGPLPATPGKADLVDPDRLAGIFRRIRRGADHRRGAESPEPVDTRWSRWWPSSRWPSSGS
jgi:hypothetical protein